MKKKIDYSTEAKLREEYILKVSKATDSELLKITDCTKFGHDEQEHLFRIKKFGINKMIEEKENWFKNILESYFDSFNILLWAIAIFELTIFFVNGRKSIDIISFSFVVFMILLAGTSDLIQDVRANRISNNLKMKVNNKFRIFHGNIDSIASLTQHLIEVNSTIIDENQITIGDLVFIKPGDVIPVDMKVLFSENLYINQSSLTGESSEIEKNSNYNSSFKSLYDLQNICFAQSSVSRGFGLGIVINIGEDNYYNVIVKSANVKPEKSYEIGLKKVIKILVLFILIWTPIIFLVSFLIQWLRNGNIDLWTNSVVFAISVAVAITPESLPTILAANLQRGVSDMAKNKVVIKDMSSIQTLGEVNILFTDKTGTLTEDEMSLIAYINTDFKMDDEILNYASINAYYQINSSSKIDEIIINSSDIKKNKLTYTKIDEFAFDYERKMVSLLIKNNETNKSIQITKGSYNEVLKRSKFIIKDGKTVSLTSALTDEIEQFVQKKSSEGGRIILVALQNEAIDSIIEKDLTIIGYLIFSDTIKQSAKNVIKLIYDYGIDLKILTGDLLNNSRKIAGQLQLHNTNGIENEEIEKMDIDQLASAIKQNTIFSKLTPLEKGRIIEAAKKNESVTAFIGDGANDIIALSNSSVGIAVNNGSSLAKKYADIILLESDLEVLEKTFVRGRIIFANAMKYMKIAIASNFGLLFAILIGVIWLNFSPMSPLQLLIQNLMYDFTNLIFIIDKVDSVTTASPIKWRTRTFIPFGIWNGMLMTISSTLNFIFLMFVLNFKNHLIGLDENSNSIFIDQFRTSFFLESLLTHFVFALVYRTETISFFKSNPPTSIYLFILAFLAFGFALVYIPYVNSTLGFEGLPGIWYAYMLGSMVFIWILGELNKIAYKKVFKTLY